MQSLIIINDAPYGTEKFYNALRLAHALLKQEGAKVDLFLIADAVTGARASQKTPEGYYNIELMLKRIVRADGKVMLCGTCMDARGMAPADMLDGTSRSSMTELADATATADRVLVF